MSSENSNFGSNSSSIGNPKHSHQKQYKSICEDLQLRLRQALNQSTQYQKQIHGLEQQLFDQKDNINQLELEKHQLNNQINSLNEEVSIHKTKTVFLKKEIEQKKEENEDLKNQINEMEAINQAIVQKFKSKSSQVKKLTQIFRENDFEGVIGDLTTKNHILSKQLKSEKESNENNMNELKTLREQNQKFQNKIERLKKKIDVHENNEKDMGKMSSKLSNLTKQLTDKTDEYKELLQKHTTSLKTIEELQAKLSEFQVIQQQNQQLKMKVDSFTIENKKLYEQIINSDNVERENEKLKSDLANLNIKLNQMNRLTDENNSLKMRVADLEFQSQQRAAQAKIEINAQSNDEYVKALRKEIKELKDQLQEANATRIERDTLLQDVRILEEKVNRLRSIESENVELKLQMETLSNEISTSKQRESRQEENIKTLMKDRQQLEIVRNKLLRIEDEVNERHIKEQHLEYQIKFLKTQVREQKLQIDSYEEEIHSLQTELFKYKETNAQYTAAEKRKSRHKSHTDKTTKNILEQLEAEKKKNLKAKSKIKNLEHTVRRYKVEFEKI